MQSLGAINLLSNSTSLDDDDDLEKLKQEAQGRVRQWLHESSHSLSGDDVNEQQSSISNDNYTDRSVNYSFLGCFGALSIFNRRRKFNSGQFNSENCDESIAINSQG